MMESLELSGLPGRETCGHEAWLEAVEQLWIDLAQLEEIGPEQHGLSDQLMNWIYTDLRKITMNNGPSRGGVTCLAA